MIKEKLGLLVHTGNPSTSEVKATASGVHGQSSYITSFRSTWGIQ